LFFPGGAVGTLGCSVGLPGGALGWRVALFDGVTRVDGAKLGMPAGDETTEVGLGAVRVGDGLVGSESVAGSPPGA
jgi:hypothetical protein